MIDIGKEMTEERDDRKTLLINASSNNLADVHFY